MNTSAELKEQFNTLMDAAEKKIRDLGLFTTFEFPLYDNSDDEALLQWKRSKDKVWSLHIDNTPWTSARQEHRRRAVEVLHEFVEALRDQDLTDAEDTLESMDMLRKFIEAP